MKLLTCHLYLKLLICRLYLKLLVILVYIPLSLVSPALYLRPVWITYIQARFLELLPLALRIICQSLQFAKNSLFNLSDHILLFSTEIINS